MLVLLGQTFLVSLPPGDVTNDKGCSCWCHILVTLKANRWPTSSHKHWRHGEYHPTARLRDQKNDRYDPQGAAFRSAVLVPCYSNTAPRALAVLPATKTLLAEQETRQSAAGNYV